MQAKCVGLVVAWGIAIAMIAHPNACSARAVKTAPAAPVLSTDETFVALRNAARAGEAERTLALAAALPADFDIPSYVEYFKLRVQLYDTGGAVRTDAPDDAIVAFLDRWRGEAIADRLRNDWLLVLGKRGDAATFDAQYPQFVLKDDPQVECYAQAFRVQRLLAGASGGVRDGVAEQARVWLDDPRNFGDGCFALFDALRSAQALGDDDVWKLVRRAYAQNAVPGARRLARAIDGIDLAGLDQVVERGQRWLAKAVLDTPMQRHIAALAIVRIARADPIEGAAALARVESAFSAADRAWLWAQVGEFGARRTLPDAYDWFKRADAASRDDRDDTTRPWQIRAALRRGDWAMVRDTIARLGAIDRRDPAWTYWHARALVELAPDAPEARAQAEHLWVSIATDWSFYGQLAIERLGGRVLAPPAPPPVTADELAPIEHSPGLQRALRLYALDLRYEGNREWNWVLRGMNDRQLLAAAEFGRRRSAFDRAVSTADRTREEHDFSLRFPTPYRDVFARAASTTGLDEAWLYGLVRQESRFVVNAHSGVGAIGLMQVMPGTARYVARKIGWSDGRADGVDDVGTNVMLGSHYLRMVVDGFDGSAVLATAAYNAGPTRARQWRATLTRAVDGALFAETIPFAETRDYVKKVLSNATYYAALFEHRAQSLESRLGVVAPAPESAGPNLP